MKTERFFVVTRWGGSEDDPSPQRLREIIAELDGKDEEHPDTWLTHRPSEWTIRLDEDRVAYLEDPECEIIRHIGGVAPEQALRLWVQFSEGGPESVSSEPWVDGPPVIPPEIVRAREERARQITLDSDRAFYQILGPERAGVPCKRLGCTRGAIVGSVFCRGHHFEQINHRPCPFND